ncbi:hypothetical protein MFLAVUS_001724 [Mucor flavus]|uniref:Nucleolar 27S pre-rRNA processing Urb2/Npa2 C-terminal domain-containing protein n=1 Tax=Mucor flavus TaxID=439312 RepID=A0ABP9YN89_9FUNG
MSDLTSEKIAKALKGAGLSAKQRVEKANEAWKNDAIFFPNKDDFLLDWICSAFAKPNMKKLDDCCLLQLPYWTLLGDLLEHYKEKAGLDSKRSVPTIHVNLVSTVSTLLQQLYKNETSTDRIEFLAAAYRCLRILFSDSFSLSYRPAFEHVSNAVDQVLTCLGTQINTFSKDQNNTNEFEVLHQLSLTAKVLLNKFDSQLVLAANQKKIFSSIVEKSLIKLLSVRRRINLLETSEDTAAISQIITEIVCHALFHADTVLEFTSVLKDANSDNTSNANVKQTNYVVKLFETLESMVNNPKDTDQMLDALDITPILFSAFLEAFRQKRNTSTSAMQDISRMAEFGLFVYLLKIITSIKEKAVSAYLETVCRLLNQLIQWNVYSARNDEIAKSQQVVLNTIADEIVSYLDDPKRYNQGLVLDVADTLLQIDFSLIESRIHSLWPIILNSEDSAQDSCLKFAKSVLNTYSASRQIDVFVEDLLKYIGHIESNSIYTMLKKPMFTREFTSDFSSHVSKSMPVAQALGIFETLQEKLISATVKSDQPVAKKQKKSNAMKQTNNATAMMISVYFVEFTNALKLSQHQQRTFSEAITSVFERFVKPSMLAWTESNTNVESTILPAMQVHSTLITVFFENYFSVITEQDRAWLAKSYIQIFQNNVENDSLGSRIVVATSANIMLQHAYYTTLSGSISNEQTTDLVNTVIDFVTEKESKSSWYESSSWDGSALDLQDKNCVKLACWKLLSDEWFDSVIRYIDSARAEKMASIIYMSLTHTAPTSSVSVQLLNKTLLRSANFYEAKCFKDCNIQTILNVFINLFKTKLLKTSSSQVSKVAANMISKMDISKSITVEQDSIKELSNALKNSKDQMDEDVDATSTSNVEKISTLLKLLLLFPNEYYEKNERPQVLYLVTCIDIWAISCANADYLTRMKVCLMCRSLQLRFMQYFSVHSILGMDSGVLDWIISSAQNWPTEASTNIEAVQNSLEHITNKLDLNILRRVIMGAGAKSPDAHSISYMQNALQQRVEGLDKNASKNTLTKVINLLNAINSVLVNRKQADVDLTNIVYATEYISKISKYINSSLQDAKSEISSILEEVKVDEQSSFVDKHKSKFETIKHIFHITRLLQDYARIVGPSVDEVISAENLSKTLTDLASPFIQFLQSALLDSSQNNHVLNMTTEFIAAFCSILSRYQQVETTKRVLAAIWFVYTLVLNTGDQEAIETLSNAFGGWIQSLSKEQYVIVIDGFIEQSEQEANNRGDATKEQNHLVFLSLLSLLLKNCTDSEKSRLRKSIPTFVLKLSLIAGKTTCLKYLQQMLKLLIQLTVDQSYHFNDYDASLVLSCLLQVAHPTAVERFQGQINQEIAHEIFDDVCAVLSNFVSQHKDQIVYMLPPFVALIQSLLHCFKSTHVSLVSGTNAPTRKRKNNADQKTLKSGRTIPLLYQFAPLNDTSAQRFGRVLTTIPQKQHSSAKNAKSTQSLYKIISRHTPSVLIEYFTIQSNTTTSIVRPSTKSILTQALYDILDMCTDQDRTFILSCLDGPGKALFKSFYMNWKDTHKYTGQ